MKLPLVASPIVRRLYFNQEFIKRISRPVRLDFGWSIPYLAGYARSGRTVYFDRDLKRYFRGIDVTDFLLVHEVTEKALIDLFGMPYQKAHHIATHFEAMAVRQHGLNWWSYIKFLKPQIKAADHKKITKVPKDLDLTPYKDEHEVKILKALMRKRNIKEELTTNEHYINFKGYVNTKFFERESTILSRNWHLGLDKISSAKFNIIKEEV